MRGCLQVCARSGEAGIGFFRRASGCRPRIPRGRLFDRCTAVCRVGVPARVHCEGSCWLTFVCVCRHRFASGCTCLQACAGLRSSYQGRKKLSPGAFKTPGDEQSRAGGLLDHRRPAAVAGYLQGGFSCAVDPALRFAVIHRLPECVDSVFEAGHRIVFARREEVERDFEFDPLVAAVYGTDIPLSPFRLATTANFPATAFSARVSSHVTGTRLMNRVHSSLR